MIYACTPYHTAPQDDLDWLVSVGFSEVRCKKALFAGSGERHEGLLWLIQHQHDDDIDIPWNLSQLQVWYGIVTFSIFFVVSFHGVIRHLSRLREMILARVAHFIGVTVLHLPCLSCQPYPLPITGASCHS